MSTPRKSWTTRRGNRLFSVYDWTHPQTGAKRWRFAWRPTASDKWRYKTCKTKPEVEEEIDRITEEMDLGGLVWANLGNKRRAFLTSIHDLVPQGDEELVLAYLSSRGKSAEISKCVDRFMKGKISAAGELTPHLGTVKRALESMAQHFQGRNVADINLQELSQWWTDRTESRGWKLKRDIRSYLVMFWRWCLREGIAGREPVTVAERLDLVASEDMDRRVLTPKELKSLMGAIGEEWRAWLVLGAFAGLRPEEIAPASNKRKGKRGLLKEEIDWRFSVIRLPACVSKVNRPRNIPMSDALKAGLQWANVQQGQKGPVCANNPAVARELSRLGKEVFKDGWPKDALRHSYGSYRNAILRSLDQVAEEMGTSIAMLHRHYHNPKAEEEGNQWFDVRPETVPIRSDKTHMNVAERASKGA